MKLLTLLLVVGGMAGQTTTPKKDHTSVWVTSNYACPSMNTSDDAEYRCVDGKWVRVTLTKAQLRFALISRVLTDAEMDQVESYGKMLYSDSTPNDGGTYYPVEMERQLNSGLLQQFKLRLAAEQAKSAPRSAVPNNGVPFFVPGGCDPNQREL